MSTRSTQKTEDMLDQTFANFDSQVTGIEEEITGKGGKSGGKSSNAMVFIATGVAAVGAIAYLFMFRGGDQPQPQQQVQAPAPQAEQTPPVASAPVVPPVATPEAQAQANPQVPPVAPAPDAQAQVNPQAPTLPSVAPIATAPASNPVPNVPTLPTPVAVNNVTASSALPTLPTPPNPVASAVPALPQVQPVKAEVPTVKPETASAGASAMVVENLQKQFESQAKELKDGLLEVNGKVSAIEEEIKNQKSVNQNVEERLVKLESGKPVAKTAEAKSEIKSEKLKKIKQQKQEEQASEKSSEEEAVVVKKNYTKKKKEAKVAVDSKKEAKKAVAKEEDSNEVLIDKTTEKKTQNVAKEVVKEVKSSMPAVNIHSIFTGRVWVKNADGSLSTFAEGDTLPTGEKIKQINDEKFEIVTNKRTISK